MWTLGGAKRCLRNYFSQALALAGISCFQSYHFSGTINTFQWGY
ncbi:hypothetical protein DSM110093_02728 [Sulfitobacter sp. DSM 110093]|nr:hypothetical protein DSM110093_02728 [Sulfitobacter sp. DSM 110093]